MSDFTANAVVNEKEVPAKLTVTGTVITFHDDDVITLTRAVPPGINPSILILNLEVNAGTGPMKGTVKNYNYESTEEDVTTFNKITVLQENGESVTTDVIKQG